MVGNSMTGSRGRELWRSLDQIADTEEFRQFVEREFPNHAPELLHQKSRRHFLKVMGASVAMAGAATLPGCVRWPVEKIHSFTYRPQGRTPGVPVEYATAFELDGVARGVVAKSFDGRPIKVDGNPQHPTSLGAADSLTQGSVLGLYDPARSHAVMSGGSEKSWADFDALLQTIRGTGGRGVHILCEASSSATLAHLRSRLSTALAQFTDAQWHAYSPISRDTERLGLYRAFGRAVRPVHRLDRADVVVSFDDDFLLTHPNAVRYTRDFAKRRRPENGRLSRLFVAEGRHSLTGSNADHRLAIRPSDVPRLIARVAARLAAKGVSLSLPGAASTLAQQNLSTPELDRTRLDGFVEEIVTDLLAARGRSLLLAGADQPAGAHALVAAVNQALDNVGKTVSYVSDPEGARIPFVDALSNLRSELESGRVEYLVILGGNPVYDAPVDLGFAQSIAKATKASIHLSLYRDETSEAATWHVPMAHYLESWGDARAWDGTHSIVQPLLQPLYGGRSAIEVIAALAGETRSAHDLSREVIAAAHRVGASDVETFWKQSLHDGFVANSAAALESLQVGSNWHDTLDPVVSRAVGEYDLVFAPDPCLHDGRFANNGWLQEQPDPMTKITWDNAAIISPADAKKIGIPTENPMGDK
ncbi:MAG: TAT-variant-translocated molybdopterin oxidoreductase, partial [Planctomycetes bacterium]|nr:TAT-variant-translocated molybdopterin oxidoreductase [Planctomycetota bacterium]